MCMYVNGTTDSVLYSTSVPISVVSFKKGSTVAPMKKLHLCYLLLCTLRLVCRRVLILLRTEDGCVEEHSSHSLS